MTRSDLLLVGAATLSLVATGRAAAQTLPSGVINAPPTVIGPNESMGSNTVLNVSDGGLVGDGLQSVCPMGRALTSC